MHVCVWQSLPLIAVHKKTSSCGRESLPTLAMTGDDAGMLGIACMCRKSEGRTFSSCSLCLIHSRILLLMYETPKKHLSHTSSSLLTSLVRKARASGHTHINARPHASCRTGGQAAGIHTHILLKTGTKEKVIFLPFSDSESLFADSSSQSPCLCL